VDDHREGSKAAPPAHLGLGFFPWWVYAAASIVAATIYFGAVLPKYRAWHTNDPKRCKDEWRERGREALPASARPSI